MLKITTQQRRLRLAKRHYLAAAAPDIVTLAGRLVGLHTSDPTTPFLASRTRVPDMTVADLEQALYDDRSVLRMVGMRRTIFVIPPVLAPLYHAACNRKNTVSQRKRIAKLLEEQDIAADGQKWLDDVAAHTLRVLRKRGPMPGRELTDLIPGFGERIEFGAGKRWGGSVSAGTRVLFIMASAGQVVRARPLGSWVSGQYRWAAMADWLGGEIEEIDTAEAQARLLDMWLRTYGPGTLVDLQWWSGWTKTETRRALDAVAAVEVELDGGPGFVLPDDVEAEEPLESRAWLLPGLDPTVMGWKERDWFLGAHAGELFDVNGNAGPTVWWDGRIVGGWGQPESGEVRYELLEKLPRRAVAAIDVEAQRLTAWLDGTRVMPRFPAPLDKRIAQGE